MADFKIIFDKPVCIGCSMCEHINPDNWKVTEEEGKSELLGSKKEGNLQILEIESLEKDLNAAQCCPVNCIHVYKMGEKLI